MGFNNGYDSGYSDCEAENRKRWEREAVERYKAENPSSGEGSGGGSSSGLTSFPYILAATFEQFFVGRLAPDAPKVVSQFRDETGEDAYAAPVPTGFVAVVNVDITASNDDYAYAISLPNDNYPDGTLLCCLGGENEVELTFTINGADASPAQGDVPGHIEWLVWFRKQSGTWRFLQYTDVGV